MALYLGVEETNREKHQLASYPSVGSSLLVYLLQALNSDISIPDRITMIL